MMRSLAVLLVVVVASAPSSSVATGAVAGDESRHTFAPLGAAIVGPAGDGGLAVKSVSAGQFSTCALAEQGDVSCWGRNIWGALGTGSYDDDLVLWPVPVRKLIGPAVDVVVGVTHACAVMHHGGVRCWGSNDFGELGNGVTAYTGGATKNPVPGDVIQLPQPMISVVAGNRWTCGLSRDGEVWCWGRQLGGAQTAQPTPRQVTSIPSGVRQVAGRLLHACAVTVVGGVWCWGDNNFGQLGNGTTAGSQDAVLVAGMQVGVTSISVAHGHSCALRDDGQAFCWGDNEFGQLGDGTVQARLAPVEVKGLRGKAVGIAAGGAQTCALLDDGDMQCWGRNAAGQLGLGVADYAAHPQPQSVRGLVGRVTSMATSVGGHPLFDLNRGGDEGEEEAGEWALMGHTCILLEHGRVQCWGANQFGQLGDGSFTRRPFPGDLFSPIAAVLLPAMVR
jgi:alpha-tubulin suppressor-like RCC1 family protein